MPRNSSGTYTLPIGAFAPGGLIKSSDHNSNYGDIATALTQSLATTGVSSMTGPVKGSAGSVGAPSYAFSTDTTSGMYLAGAHQLGFATNGVQVATFNSDQSATWAGAASWAGAVTYNGTTTLNGATTFNATSYTFGAGAGNAFVQGMLMQADVTLIIDGGGSVITTGVKGRIRVPFSATIGDWHIMGDQSGSITIDILRANDAVPAASIVGAGTKPNLTASQFTEAVPSGWTSVTLAANDWLAFNVTGAVTNVTQVTIALRLNRTSP